MQAAENFLFYISLAIFDFLFAKIVILEYQLP